MHHIQGKKDTSMKDHIKFLAKPEKPILEEFN